MLNEEKFRDFCYLYFLNALDNDEKAEFLAALRSKKTEYKRIYLKVRRLFYLMPLAAEMKDPPESLKDELLKIIKAPSPNSDKLLDKLAEYLKANKLRLIML
ncbi:MAG: hypothetical protein ACM3S2_02195 [Ignavibacteriales bacterium]